MSDVDSQTGNRDDRTQPPRLDKYGSLEEAVERVHHAVTYAASLGGVVMEQSSLTHFVFDCPGWRYDEDDMLIRDGRS